MSACLFTFPQGFPGRSGSRVRVCTLRPHVRVRFLRVLGFPPVPAARLPCESQNAFLHHSQFSCGRATPCTAGIKREAFLWKFCECVKSRAWMRVRSGTLQRAGRRWPPSVGVLFFFAQKLSVSCHVIVFQVEALCYTSTSPGLSGFCNESRPPIQQACSWLPYWNHAALCLTHCWLSLTHQTVPISQHANFCRFFTWNLCEKSRWWPERLSRRRLRRRVSSSVLRLAPKNQMGARRASQEAYIENHFRYRSVSACC